MRWLAAFSLVLAQSVFAQQSPGVTRFPFPDDGPQRDPSHMVASGNVLWAASSTNGVVDRIGIGGSARRFDLPFWGGAWDIAVAQDESVWVATRHYVARLDPTTGALKTWPDYRSAWPIIAGPDGNIWFVYRADRYNRPTVVRVIAMAADGRVVQSIETGGPVSGMVFDSEGALWLSMPNGTAGTLVRITSSGARTEFPVAVAGRLEAGSGFLWIASNDIVRVDLQGHVLGTYRVAMNVMGADAGGNLWLRTLTDTGEQVAQLTPNGVLTRFGPLAALPRDECLAPIYGGFAALADGRVAMTDYYPLIGYRPEDHCAMTQRAFPQENEITILDPAVAPVLSVEQLNVAPRRRITRH